MLPQLSPQAVPSLLSNIPARISSSESFVSAKEDFSSHKPSEDVVNVDSRHGESAFVPAVKAILTCAPPEEQYHVLPEPQTAVEQITVAVGLDDAMEMDQVQTPSDGSSPLQPLMRKSSMTFASLPAREPLAKTSIGARISHVDPAKSFGRMSSQVGRGPGMRSTGGHAPAGNVPTNYFEDAETDVANMRPPMDRIESESTKIHNKTSTQRLHDRINMLGQSREIGVSKSFQNTSSSHVLTSLQPQDATKQHNATDGLSKPEMYGQKPSSAVADDNEDWIAPITRLGGFSMAFETQLIPSKEADLVNHISDRLAGIQSPRTRQNSPSRAAFHKKMASTTVLESPTRAAMAPDANTQKPISVSNPTPNLSAGNTTTPVGSPPRSPSGRRLLDGPLSASKAKLYSVLKSAKGIFASSAGVSAQAKMEALSPGRVRKIAEEPMLSPSADIRPNPALFAKPISPVRMASPTQDARRTRSSTEREARQKHDDEQKRAAGGLDKAREKERHKAAAAAAQKMNRALAAPKASASRPNLPSRMETESSKSVLGESSDDMPPPPPPKSMLPTQTRTNAVRRAPAPRPVKDTASKAKPAPVTVRMPSQRIGQVAQPSSAVLNQSLQDTLPPPPPPPPKTGYGSRNGGGVMAQANSSATSVRGTAASAKRALEAAAKKKDMEAKAAQRKADQKREADQKRAQRQEEERKQQEQRRAAEQQKAQEARKAAQRKADEAKRQEEQRREAAQRPESRHNALAAALQQERAGGANQAQRGDVGGARPISKANLVHDPPRPQVQINPAKPPKRALAPDGEEEYGGQRAGGVQRNPPSSYQQLDGKRRKTNETEDIPEQRVSVMGPPMRQSNIRKVCSSSPFDRVQTDKRC
jgi:hypothetical protein